MTDANGTRNIRTGNQSPGNASSNGTAQGMSQGPANANATPGHSRIAIERPKLNISSSRYLPKPTASGDKVAANGKASKATAAGVTNAGTTNAGVTNPASEKPNSARLTERLPSRRQATEEKNTRRRRSSSRSGSTAERRRLFGTVPDRIKRKSSSRTRALKAKTATPSRIQDRKLKASATVTPLAKKSATKSAIAAPGKTRPVLPNSSYPGRVPPARGLVRKRRRASKRYTTLRRGLQLLIAGVGLAAIGGTLLTMLPDAPEPTTTEAVVAPPPPAKTFPVALAPEISELKASLQELPNLYPSLTPKIFYVDIDTGKYASVEGTETVAAASTIKLPILLAFFEEIDAGRIDPNQTMAIQAEQIAEGSGDMQLSAPGTQFTALEVATQMIISSDNTATNMMIDLLGGKELLNTRFQAQGLEKTVLNAPLPDLEGSNTTSARDLVHTMLLISQGEDLTMRSRDRILNILNRTRNKSLLANGPMEQGALTYNKTGDIGSVLGDVALVDLPNGKRYAIATLVERPTNDGRAQELIRRISGQTYQESAKAVQPAVTPLGNVDSGADSAADGGAAGTATTGGAAAGESPDPAAATPDGEPAVPAEEPYPSANPRD